MFPRKHHFHHPVTHRAVLPALDLRGAFLPFHNQNLRLACCVIDTVKAASSGVCIASPASCCQPRLQHAAKRQGLYRGLPMAGVQVALRVVFVVQLPHIHAPDLGPAILGHMVHCNSPTNCQVRKGDHSDMSCWLSPVSAVTWQHSKTVLQKDILSTPAQCYNLC